MKRQVYQSSLFERQKKYLSKKEIEHLDNEIKLIQGKPEIGEAKRGGLAGVCVHSIGISFLSPCRGGIYDAPQSGIRPARHRLRLQARRAGKSNPYRFAPKVRYVHKFKVGRKLFLLAYELNESEILLLALGPHENFYRDLKKYLK